MPTDASTRRSRRLALAGTALLGVALLVTAIPAPFTVDDVHYLSSVVALRDGGWTLPATAGLPPSRELLSFDPGGKFRQVRETPVGPRTPPLYALLALPFSVAGWRGLVAMNVVGFLASTWLVWALAARVGRRRSTPLVAAGTFLLAGYGLEYAQGLWPHMVAVALVVGAVAAAERSRDPGASAFGWALLSGSAAGIAAGVRYQNVVVVLALGLVLALWSRRRGRALAGYFLGSGAPLLASSLINHVRFGSWNPISKGPGYLSITEGGGRGTGGALSDALITLWFRVVDFGVRPLPSYRHLDFLHREPGSGMVEVLGVAKKAWLQSCPWIAVSLVFALGATTAWLSRRRRLDEPTALAARLGAPVAAVLAAFALAGSGPIDGFGFNQRYFLELLPLVAVLFALATEDLCAGSRRSVLVGYLGGASLALYAAGSPGLSAERWLPVGLAALSAGAVLWFRWRETGVSKTLAVVAVTAAVAWSPGVHVATDLLASRELRGQNQSLLLELRRRLPAGPVAIFTHRENVDAPGALMLERPLLVVDTELDDGAAAAELREALLQRGDRVLLLRPLPAAIEDRLVAGRALRYRGAVAGGLVELVDGSGRP